jgi:tripartite-type tricarboxylate transporter receptor subunit TctC
MPTLIGGYSPYWDLNAHALGNASSQKIEIVSYKGTPEVLRGIIGKEIDLALLSNGPNVMALVTAGKLHIVGSTYHNDYTLDGVPLLSVSKYTGVLGFSSFVGLALKPNLDPAKSAYLKKELWRAVNTPEMKTLIEVSGGVVDSTNNQTQMWQQIVALRERVKKLMIKNK